LSLGYKWTTESWRRWVEPWYLAYALLGTSAAGLVPMLLPLAVHLSRGAAYVGWVIAAYKLGGFTAPLWGILADRYRLHRYLVVGGGVIAAAGLAAFQLTPAPSAWPALALLQGIGTTGAATIANLFVVEAHRLAPDVLWRGAGLWTLRGGGVDPDAATHWLACRSWCDSSRRADGMAHYADPSQSFDSQIGPPAAATTE